MKHLTAIAALLIATAAAAHDGVQNPAVMARMKAMEIIGKNTRHLGDMAKGEADFDPGLAQLAAAEVATQAERAKTLFKAPEQDPKSEALPAIWENYADFLAKTDSLIKATETVNGVASEDELIAAMQQIGAACKSCHADYRK